jgi:hypothetical protein
MAAAVRRGEPEAHAVRQPHRAADAVASMLEAVFNEARLSALSGLHDRAIALVLPGNRRADGVVAGARIASARLQPRRTT